MRRAPSRVSRFMLLGRPGLIVEIEITERLADRVLNDERLRVLLRVSTVVGNDAAWDDESARATSTARRLFVDTCSVDNPVLFREITVTAIVVASQNSLVLRAKTKVIAPIVARRLVRLDFRNRRDGDDPELVVFHQLVFDRSSLTRWRQRMSEEKLLALLQESPAVRPEPRR